eukprot:6206446-Amphidinium_carterae.1
MFAFGIVFTAFPIFRQTPDARYAGWPRQRASQRERDGLNHRLTNQSAIHLGREFIVTSW